MNLTRPHAHVWLKLTRRHMSNKYRPPGSDFRLLPEVQKYLDMNKPSYLNMAESMANQIEEDLISFHISMMALSTDVIALMEGFGPKHEIQSAEQVKAAQEEMEKRQLIYTKRAEEASE